MPRIIVLDKLSPEGLALLKSAPNIEFEVRTGLKGDELRQTLTEFDGAICRSGVKITAEALEGNRRLRAIVRAGVGTDNIDKNAATRLGIIVMNTPTGNTISTAEHAFTLMLALSRNIAPAHQSLLEGKWDRNSYMGSQLAEKTLGVVGLGRIGQEVAKRAMAFQMKVIGYDPFLSAEQAAKMGLEYSDSVRGMLSKVDYLTVHTPLTPETKDLIGMPELELLKPGIRLINAARGGIYNEAALVEGLKTGKIGGVALDVFENEPCTDSPLFKLKNVVCTPHLGASTEEAQNQVAIEAVELLVNYFSTGEIRHAVNMAAVDQKTLRSLQGFIDLSFRLGRFLAQWHEGAPTACKVQYRGDVATKNTKLLTSSFCAGLLQGALEEDVNIVNAEMLLRERGVRVSEESQPEPGAFSSSITIELSTKKETFIAGGTLFGNSMPRLIRIGEFRLETYLDGNLMIFVHDDVPGIIGSVGTTLGKHHVNIAQMSVGRAGATAGGAAIGILQTDGVPVQAAIDEVLQHKHIQSIRIISLPPAGQMMGT